MKNFYLFRCSDRTYDECISRKLFGQGNSMGKSVSPIKPGDVLFLNNINKVVNQQNDFIEGPYYADSEGKQNIAPEAWGGGFPWQVKIKTIENPRRIQRNDYLNFMGIPYANVFYPFEISPEKGEKLLESMGINLIEEEIIIRENIVDIENDERLRFPSRYRCEDGHYVKSLSEMLIDNWFYNHGIVHAYERIVPIKERIISDFYIKNANLYIEFWGMKTPEYLKRKERKLELYKANNLNLINLENEHIQNLDDILPQQLRKYNLQIN